LNRGTKEIGGRKLKDTEIIELYWDRQESAITETQKVYGKYCYSIAFNILHDREDSDECVNDTWLRAWYAIPPKRPVRLSLFLGTITRNLSFDKWKHKKALKRGNGEMELALDELMECVPAARSTEDAVEAAELERLINEFLRTLSERECNVFLRRYWYVEEYSDIAKRFQMNLNTVKTSLFRTRGKLKAFLEQEGIVL
jgi:RNA polymerase sigma-70 factor (ECF subfamily)